jgi:hypothetical protein
MIILILLEHTYIKAIYGAEVLSVTPLYASFTLASGVVAAACNSMQKPGTEIVFEPF